MARFTVERHNPSYEAISTSRLKSRGRPALLLSLECRLGGVSVASRGEANPLPGYGSDELSVCEEELRSLSLGKVLETAEHLCRRHSWGSPKIEEELLFLSSDLRSPAARFGIETLVLGAAAGACGVPMWRILANEVRFQRLATSAVVDPFSSTWRERASAQLGQGVRTFKVKCGRDDALELDVCREISGRIAQGGPICLRLDPNGAWNDDETARFSSQARDLPIEWIEDPTREPRSWESIESPFPFAIDEPLGILSVEEALATGARFFVLKPMALGGFSACKRWARAAVSHERKVSLSHFFDGPIAFDATAHLAFALQSDDLTPGLGVHQALKASWPDDVKTLSGVDLVLPT